MDSSVAFHIGGERSVHRLGVGTMRLTELAPGAADQRGEKATIRALKTMVASTTNA
jgi:hypothetical protein